MPVLYNRGHWIHHAVEEGEIRLEILTIVEVDDIHMDQSATHPDDFGMGMDARYHPNRSKEMVQQAKRASTLRKSWADQSPDTWPFRTHTEEDDAKCERVVDEKVTLRDGQRLFEVVGSDCGKWTNAQLCERSTGNPIMTFAADNMNGEGLTRCQNPHCKTGSLRETYRQQGTGYGGQMFCERCMLKRDKPK